MRTDVSWTSTRHVLNRRRAFTLIELLIVMIIIAALAAIAFPVFSSVRRRAHQATCISNLRQLGLAVQQYAQDSNGYIPPYNTWVDVGYYDPDTHQHVKPTDKAAQLTACLAPYIHDSQIWFCPEDIYARTASMESGVNHLYTSYATTGDWWYVLDGYHRLGQTLIDKPNHNGPNATASDRTLFSDNLWGCIVMTNQAAPPYSHNERYNSVMFDGHVVSGINRDHGEFCGND